MGFDRFPFRNPFAIFGEQDEYNQPETQMGDGLKITLAGFTGSPED